MPGWRAVSGLPWILLCTDRCLFGCCSAPITSQAHSLVMSLNAKKKINFMIIFTFNCKFFFYIHYWYLILRFWRDSVLWGFIFAISMAKYEKRAKKKLKRATIFICGSLISRFVTIAKNVKLKTREIKYQ